MTAARSHPKSGQLVTAAMLLIAALTISAQAQGASKNASFDAVTSLKAYAAYKAGNYLEAKRIWQGLAEKGNTTAMINLANMFQQGQGVTENQRHALSYVEEAAQLGDKRAQYELGTAYESGITLNRNIEQAAYWLKKSAENGSPDGQFAYAVLLATVPDEESKTGDKQVSAANKERAICWLKEAHKNGHLEAKDYIGVLSNQP